MVDSKVNFAVGLFVIFGIAGAIFLSVKLGNIALFESDYYALQAQFDSVSGLKKNADIEIAGVKVGYVEDIQMVNGDALLTLKLQKNIKVEDDAILSVRSKGLIGDKFLKLSPGGSTDIMKPGDKIIETESSLDIEDLIGKFIHKME